MSTASRSMRGWRTEGRAHPSPASEIQPGVVSALKRPGTGAVVARRCRHPSMLLAAAARRRRRVRVEVRNPDLDPGGTLHRRHERLLILLGRRATLAAVVVRV